MRPDQLQQLQELSEQLADEFISEAKPADWPGGRAKPAEMSQKDRGDRYWCKKNAMATAGVLRYTLDLISSHADRAPDPAEEDALDAKVSDAYKRAQAAVKAAQNRAKEAAR